MTIKLSVSALDMQRIEHLALTQDMPISTLCRRCILDRPLPVFPGFVRRRPASSDS